MNGKAQMVKAYAEKFGVTKKSAETTIDNVMEVMTDLIADGGVKVVGQFTISVKESKARDYKTPKGETVHKDAHKTLKIKVGSDLDKRING